jgi:membrane protease YdiL (CAAX protease family)
MVDLPQALEHRGWSWLEIHFAIFGSRFAVAAVLLLIVVPMVLRLPTPVRSVGAYLDAIGLTRVRPLRRTLAPALLAMTLFWAGSAGLALALGIFEPSWQVVLGNPDPDARSLGWFMFVLALIPGIWEEVAFRGVVLRTLLTRHSERVALLGSGAFFALFHLANVILGQSLPEVVMKGLVALPVGVALAHMVVRTGSLLPAIITHYLMDCFGPFFVAVGPDSMIRGAIFGITAVGVLAPLCVVFATRLATRR